ncbi:MAG TPA: hypothetical protein VGK47_14890 [Nitrososphaeraceae archaeon]
MLPYQMIAGGRFTLNATTVTGVNVRLVGMADPDFIICRSITGWGEASDAQAIQWWWAKGMAQNSARGIFQSSDATNPALTSRILPAAASTADAISYFDTANPPTYAALTATTTNNTTFVVAMASTAGIMVGDVVRMYSVTAMQQISSMDFQVTAVTTNVSITLGMMATAVTASANSFAASGTAAQVLKFIPGRFYPRYRYIAGITRAAQARVYFTVAHDFTPGEFIGLRIPVNFGLGAWTSINNRDARVLSIVNTATESSVLLDLDTSGITNAFVSPTSAVAAAGFTPAVAVPSTSGVVPFNGSATVPQEPPGTNLQDAFDNRNVRYIRFGNDLFNTTSFTSDVSDVWCWEARKYDDYRIDIF